MILEGTGDYAGVFEVILFIDIDQKADPLKGEERNTDGKRNCDQELSNRIRRFKKSFADQWAVFKEYEYG
jgi:hypothetical protein